MSLQVDKKIYFGSGYFNINRFASYSYQISEIISLKPEKVLEIGVGNGLVSYLLKEAGISTTTLDFDPSLKPDILASVTDIPAANNFYDVVAAFEVLEHVPFESFSKAISEMCRVSKKNVIISLPDCNRFYKIECVLPKIGKKRLSLELPYKNPRIHNFDGEHYWEIGKKGFPLRRIIQEIQRIGLEIERTYRAFEIPYHRFFILKKM